MWNFWMWAALSSISLTIESAPLSNNSLHTIYTALSVIIIYCIDFNLLLLFSLNCMLLEFKMKWTELNWSTRSNSFGNPTTLQQAFSDQAVSVEMEAVSVEMECSWKKINPKSSKNFKTISLQNDAINFCRTIVEVVDNLERAIVICNWNNDSTQENSFQYNLSEPKPR